MKNSHLRLSILLTAILSGSFPLFADGEKTYGPYTAIAQNAEIVKDVKIAENGRIYLLLNPDFKEKEIILKNSNFYQSGYRNWFNGEKELISPAGQGKAPNEFTDWVETTANYVEYYMDGQLILHLGKTEVHAASSQ